MSKVKYAVFGAMFILALLLPSAVAALDWPDGYLYMKSIPITAAAPYSQSGNYSATNNGDGRMAEAAPNTNYGSETFLLTTSQGAGSRQRSVLQFDTSEFGNNSDIIDSAKLRLYYYGYYSSDPQNRTIWAYKCTKDFIEAQFTWNKYTSSNFWDAAGGDYVTSNPSGDSEIVPSSFGWMEWDITAIVTDAVSNNLGEARILLKDGTESGSSAYIPYWYSKNYATESYRPQLIVSWALAAGSIPSQYILPIDVYKEEPTVEEGSWAVNAKTANYRIAFDVTTWSTLSAGYQIPIVIDTASIVTGGFLGGSGAAYGKVVEFDDSTPSDGYYYWATTSAGSIANFNTTNTRYFVGLPAQAGNTTATYYLYFDPDWSAGSPSDNFAPASLWDFFDDFSTDVGNLSSFLGNYTLWENDTGSPTVSVSSSILTLTGDAADDWDSIATKTSGGFTAGNFTMISRITGAPTTLAIQGTVDTAGLGGANIDGIALYKWGEVDFITWSNGVGTPRYSDYLTAPFIYEWDKYADQYRWILMRDDDASEPDTTGDSVLVGLDATDVLHKITVSSYNANTISLDWIAVGDAVLYIPTVVFPDVTYPRAGAIFLNNHAEHWGDTDESNEIYYDLMVTDEDNNPIYWCPDPLAQITRQPSDAIQIYIRDTVSCSADHDLRIYYGNANMTSKSAYQSASDVYQDSGNFYEDFSGVSDWTSVSGNWTSASVGLPILDKGFVGNVGGGAGRLWARMPCVIPWNGAYKLIFTNVLWEHAGQHWPVPYRPYVADMASLDSVATTGQLLTTDVSFSDTPFGYFVSDAKVYDGICYVLLVHEGYGFDVIYTDDFVDWEFNTHGTFLTGSGVFSFWLTKNGSAWYVIGGSGDRVYWWDSTSPPEDWASDSDLGSATEMIYGGGAHLEDGCTVYDGSRYWYTFLTFVDDPIYEIRYWTLDTNSYTFPSNDLNWVPQGTVNYQKPPWARLTGSPRIVPDSSNWWLYYHGSPTTDANSYIERWTPDWIAATKSTSGLNGAFTLQETDTRYKENTYSSGSYRSYLTNGNFTNGEVMAEVQAGLDGDGRIGLIFRYNPTTDSGYYTELAWNTAAPVVRLYSFSGSTYTSLASAVSTPNYPVPCFRLGFPARIKAKCYLNEIEIWYSLYGNPWVKAFDVTSLRYLSGKVGVQTITSVGYINDLRLRTMVFNEPSVGEAGEAQYYLEITTLAATSVGGDSATLNGNVTGTAPIVNWAFWWGDNDAGAPISMAKGSWDNYYYHSEELGWGETFNYNAGGLSAETCYYFVAGGNTTTGSFDVGIVLEFCTTEGGYEPPVINCECPQWIAASIGSGGIALQWQIGDGNETIGALIKVDYDVFPTSPDEGVTVYEGNDSSADHHLPIDYLLAVPHYSAFGVCDGGGGAYYTTDYNQIIAEGMPMTDLIQLLGYLTLPLLLLCIALIKRNIGVIIATIVGLGVVAAPVADIVGGWILAPFVLLMITLALMAFRDLVEGRVEL